MVAQPRRKSQSASRARIERDTLVQRSKSLSVGARFLWVELSRGWAWRDNQVCFPNQKVLIESLGVSESSLRRWINELCKVELLSKRRTPKGNTYTLAKTVPETLCDPRRVSNKHIAEAARHLTCDDGDRWEDMDYVELPVDLTGDDVDDVQTDRSDRPQPPVKLTGGSRTDRSNRPVPPVKLTDAIEAVEEKQQKEEKQKKGSRDAKRTTTASSSASKPDSSSAVEETQAASVCSLGVVNESGSGDTVEDLDDLLQEDDAPRRKKSNRRSKRGKRSPALVDLPGSGLRTASKLPSGPGSINAEPPPPSTPEDVLELLRGEIEEKFGAKAARGLTGELTAKEKGQIQNSVLRKYEPTVVLAMIRVLVWDWEVARKTIFPFRPDRAIPLPENLAQYAKDLAAATSIGLTYSGDLRGAVNTYSHIYIKRKGIVEDDDPF